MCGWLWGRWWARWDGLVDAGSPWFDGLGPLCPALCLELAKWYWFVCLKDLWYSGLVDPVLRPEYLMDEVLLNLWFEVQAKRQDGHICVNSDRLQPLPIADTPFEEPMLLAWQGEVCDPSDRKAKGLQLLAKGGPGCG